MILSLEMILDSVIHVASPTFQCLIKFKYFEQFFIGFSSISKVFQISTF